MREFNFPSRPERNMHGHRPSPSSTPRPPENSPSSSQSGNPPARPARTPPPIQTRITVRETVFWSRLGSSPGSQVTGFQRVSSGIAGDPCQVEMIIGSDWVPLDLSSAAVQAISRVGQLTIANMEGSGITRRPTPEQLAAVMARVVQIGFGDDPQADLLVSPKEGQRIEPGVVTRIRLRCASETARVLLSFFPG